MAPGQRLRIYWDSYYGKDRALWHRVVRVGVGAALHAEVDNGRGGRGCASMVCQRAGIASAHWAPEDSSTTVTLTALIESLKLSWSVGNLEGTASVSSRPG